MKLFTCILLLFSVIGFSQDHKELEILEADSTWTKELIRFPLGFAPQINFEGYEDIRFAKNWNTPTSSEFFTYAFVWKINLSQLPTTKLLNDNMTLYYDGLMRAVNKDKTITVPDTKVNFTKNDSTKTLPEFKGTINVYDAFFTKKVIDLFANVETFYCAEKNTYVLLFRISSFNFEDTIWKKLKTVTLTPNFCK